MATGKKAPPHSLEGEFTVPREEAAARAVYLTERTLQLPAGLPGRPWYTHALTVPGQYTSYGAKTIPGVQEALELGRYAEAELQRRPLTESKLDGSALIFEVCGGGLAVAATDRLVGPVYARIGRGGALVVKLRGADGGFRSKRFPLDQAKPGSWERRSSPGGPISLCRATAPRFAQRVIAQYSQRRRKDWGWLRLTGMNCCF